MTLSSSLKESAKLLKRLAHWSKLLFLTMIATLNSTHMAVQLMKCESFVIYCAQFPLNFLALPKVSHLLRQIAVSGKNI